MVNRWTFNSNDSIDQRLSKLEEALMGMQQQQEDRFLQIEKLLSDRLQPPRMPPTPTPFPQHQLKPPPPPSPTYFPTISYPASQPTPPSQSTQLFSPPHSLQSTTQFQSPQQFSSTHQLHNLQPLHPILPSQTSPPTNIISSNHTYQPSLEPKTLSNSYQPPLSSPTPPPPLVSQPTSTPKSKYSPLRLLFLTTIQMTEKHAQIFMLIGTIEDYDDPDIAYNGRASNPGDYG